MKFEFDKKYFKICVYGFGAIAALLLFQRILQSSGNVWQSCLNGISFLLTLLTPFIFAIVIAYILNPAVSGLEMLLGKIFKNEKFARGRKLISLLFIYAAAITVIVMSLYFVIPGIIRNVSDLFKNLPEYFKQLQAFYNNTLLAYPLFSTDVVQTTINTLLDSFNSFLSQYLASAVSGVTGILLNLVSYVASGIIGLVLSFYLLNERANIVAGFTRLLKTRLGEKKASGVTNFLNSVDKVFGRYISAKLLFALIMFVLCLVVFIILNVPYGVLMSAIVALSTLVPYIGPFIGAIPPIVVSLVDSPQMAIYVVVSIIVIHSVGGYFIEPHIVGNKIGLSPFWILLSIILGGGLFGLLGVLLAVPVAAVIKLLIVKYIQSRQLRRHRDADSESERERCGLQP